MGVLVAAVGLYFVWRQIGMVKRQLALTNYMEYTRRYSEIILTFPDEINYDDFVLESREDKSEILRAMRSYFDLCFEERDLFQRNMIDSESWSVWEGGIAAAMKRTAFQQAWPIVRDSSAFGSDFNKWVDQLAK